MSGKEEDARLRELGGGRILPLLWKFAWPALVTMTLNTLYNVIDRVYIGHGCGSDAIAGLTLTFPVMMVMGAFGPLIGVGSGTIISISLGEKNLLRAERALGQCVALKLLLGVTVAPALFLFLDPILHAMAGGGVTDGAIAAARLYLRINVLFHFLAHLAFGLSACMRSEGSPVAAMRCMVVGAVANLVLDPLFIFAFGMGIAGAAWATNIAMFASCLWALGYYLRGRTVVRLRLRRIGFYRRLAPRAAGVGLAPFLQQLMSALIAVSLQVAFTKWIPDKASRTAQIASLGVFQSALILILMPLLGTQQGLQPIIGFNWGARNFRRVLGTLKTGFWVTAALCFAAWVVQVVPPFPRLIARMFVSADNESLVDLAAHDLALSNCMIWCIAVNIVATTYFQSIGRPKSAIVLSMLRQGVCLLPTIWILPYFMEDKALSIWLSMPVSDVLCNLATIPPILMHARFLARVRPRSIVRVKSPAGGSCDMPASSSRSSS